MRAPVLALALLAAAAAPAAAQLAVEPYAGLYRFDDGPFDDLDPSVEADPSPLLGVRLGFGPIPGWRLEAGYGFSNVSLEGPEFGELVDDFPEDPAVHLFYGALNWHLPLPIDLFLSGGAGAIRFNPEQGEATTDLAANFGVGLTIPITGSLRLRADLKDHLQLCEAPDDEDAISACLDDETLHNVELSAGLQIGP